MKSLRYGLYRFKYLNGQHLPLKAPVDVSLELSSLCNMRCTYCYHADKKAMPFKQKLMSWETARQILLEASELGVNSLKMNWRGESTQNPIFPRVTALAKDLSNKSVFIDRVTNSNFKFDTNNDEIFRGFAIKLRSRSHTILSARMFLTRSAPVVIIVLPLLISISFIIFLDEITRSLSKLLELQQTKTKITRPN